MRAAASKPPEERGLTRDGVRMLAATPDGLAHAIFSDLPRFLSPGDLLVVNTSATIAAAVDGTRADRRPVTVSFSTPLDDGTWLTELRTGAAGHQRVLDGSPGETISLPGGLSVTLLCQLRGSDRMWVTAGRFPARCPRGARTSRPADPVLLCPRPVAALGVPDRVRPRSGQRRNAERWPAVHYRTGRPGWSRPES